MKGSSIPDCSRLTRASQLLSPSFWQDCHARLASFLSIWLLSLYHYPNSEHQPLFCALTASHYLILLLIMMSLFFTSLSLSFQMGVVMLQQLKCTWRLCRASCDQVFTPLLLYPAPSPSSSLLCATQRSLFLHSSLRGCGEQRSCVELYTTPAESSVCCKCRLVCLSWHITTYSMQRGTSSDCHVWLVRLQTATMFVCRCQLNADFHQHIIKTYCSRTAHMSCENIICSINGVLLNYSYWGWHHSGWCLTPDSPNNTSESHLYWNPDLK